MVTQTINPLSARRDLSKTGLKTTSIHRVDQDLFYVRKPTLNSTLILVQLRGRVPPHDALRGPHPGP